jgi:hypothetical protein
MPADAEIEKAFDAFATTAVPCNRILLKRIPTEQLTNPYKKPGSRFYQAGKSEKEKIFGQEYVIWYFDDHKLLSKEHIAPGMKNAEGEEYNRFSFSFVYNMAFPGNNAYRDMYIIEDANIHNRSEHPFISSAKGESINQLNAKLNDINMHIKILQQKINEADANNDATKKDKLAVLFRHIKPKLISKRKLND